MDDESIPKDFEDLVKDVHWLNEADPKALMMRLRCIEVLWSKLQKKIEQSKSETDPPPENILSLLILSGIVAAKIAPAVGLTSEELSHIIKAEAWNVPDLVKYLEKKLNV